MRKKRSFFVRILKWAGISLLVMISLGALFGTLGLKETLALPIDAVDLGSIPDGAYTGIYDCYRWTSEVNVTVKGHAITGIAVVKGQSDRDDIRQQLIDRVLQAQTPAVDAVSGATADSKAFLKAVENALVNAGK